MKNFQNPSYAEKHGDAFPDLSWPAAVPAKKIYKLPQGLCKIELGDQFSLPQPEHNLPIRLCSIKRAEPDAMQVSCGFHSCGEVF